MDAYDIRVAAFAGPVMVGVTGIRGAGNWKNLFDDPYLGVMCEGFDKLDLKERWLGGAEREARRCSE